MSKKKESERQDEAGGRTSLQKLLAEATRAEIESAATYRSLLDRDLPEETRSKLERLVEQEEEHEDKLWDILGDFFPEEEVTLPESSGIEDPGEVSQEASPEELIEKAMEAELDSEEFYRELIEEFEDQEIKRLLGFLASTEREHYEILKEELKKLRSS
ncbi:ferritin family protein [Candidatus Bipolaricaulota bacterium]|nr:ferritin family protein [Candidatus Bipolaricaulota bacterium]